MSIHPRRTSPNHETKVVYSKTPQSDDLGTKHICTADCEICRLRVLLYVVNGTEWCITESDLNRVLHRRLWGCRLRGFTVYKDSKSAKIIQIFQLEGGALVLKVKWPGITISRYVVKLQMHCCLKVDLVGKSQFYNKSTYCRVKVARLTMKDFSFELLSQL